jgi:hypothetical protein
MMLSKFSAPLLGAGAGTPESASVPVGKAEINMVELVLEFKFSRMVNSRSSSLLTVYYNRGARRLEGSVVQRRLPL